MSLDAQSSPRVVRSGWPPLVQEWAEPRFVEPVTESVRVVVDPASEHVAAGRAQIVRFANEIASRPYSTTGMVTGGSERPV